MKEEIAAAVFFVARLVKRYGSLDTEGRERFAAALTSVLFENYKNHWHVNTPSKGQAYRCLRVNHSMLKEPTLLRACERALVSYEELGLPQELTVWVDPGDVSCRYGERSSPFCVTALSSSGGCRGDGEFSRRIHEAVERAGLEVRPGSSSDDEDDNDLSLSLSSSGSNNSNVSNQSTLCPNPEPKSIPTVSNPNSVYRFSEFALGAPQTWLTFPKRHPNIFSTEAFPPLPPPAGPAPTIPSQKNAKPYRATFTFTGPRVDKYHWVSKSRS